MLEGRALRAFCGVAVRVYCRDWVSPLRPPASLTGRLRGKNVDSAVGSLIPALFATLLIAQQKPSATKADSVPTFRSQTRLVLVDVIVEDGKGRLFLASRRKILQSKKTASRNTFPDSTCIDTKRRAQRLRCNCLRISTRISRSRNQEGQSQSSCWMC